MATIGCKLPNGLTIDHKGKTVTLIGANHPKAVAGFGLTHDVDAEWFNDWIGEDGPGKRFPAVVNGSIFIAKSESVAEDMADERTNDDGVKTGQEPLDPNAPAAGVEPTDEQKKELEKVEPTANKAPAAPKVEGKA